MYKEKFSAYESVRKSGFCNMFDINQVIYWAKKLRSVDLSLEDVLEIKKNYPKYVLEFQTGY